MKVLKGWGVYLLPAGEKHVMPVCDSTEHACSSTCWCLPRLDGDVWVHSAADGREKAERLETRH